MNEGGKEWWGIWKKNERGDDDDDHHMGECWCYMYDGGVVGEPKRGSYGEKKKKEIEVWRWMNMVEGIVEFGEVWGVREFTGLKMLWHGSFLSNLVYALKWGDSIIIKKCWW